MYTVSQHTEREGEIWFCGMYNSTRIITFCREEGRKIRNLPGVWMHVCRVLVWQIFTFGLSRVAPGACLFCCYCCVSTPWRERSFLLYEQQQYHSEFQEEDDLSYYIHTYIHDTCIHTYTYIQFMGGGDLLCSSHLLYLTGLAFSTPNRVSLARFVSFQTWFGPAPNIG